MCFFFISPLGKSNVAQAKVKAHWESLQVTLHVELFYIATVVKTSHTLLWYFTLGGSCRSLSKKSEEICAWEVDKFSLPVWWTRARKLPATFLTLPWIPSIKLILNPQHKAKWDSMCREMKSVTDLVWGLTWVHENYCTLSHTVWMNTWLNYTTKELFIFLSMILYFQC